MGRAFRRLTKQVEGRTTPRKRWLPIPQRLLQSEKLLLELAAYLATEVANDEASASDQALVEAYHEFKKFLEGVVENGS